MMRIFTFIRLIVVLPVFCIVTAGQSLGQTYCTPTYTNLCTSDDFINNFVFNTLYSPNSGCNGNANNYVYYSTAPTTSVQQGSSYGIAVQSGPAWEEGFGVWIDYNKDGDFTDSLEFVYSSPISDTSLFTGTITIPGTASTGVTRLRVRCKYGATVIASESCTNMSYGETEDYDITITAGTACTNPPTAGTAFASVDSVCPGISFTLILQGNSTGIGQTLQWQSSPDNITWSNIAGATGITHTLTQSNSSYYRCMVTCGSAVPSATDFVKTSSPSQCYCTAVHSTVCSTTDNIDTVIIVGTTLNNSGTSCTSGNATAYTVYPASGNTTATLTRGSSYSISVTSTDNSIISAWIDFNQNGTFESSEWTQITTSSTANVPATVSIYISDSALTGQTRIRIRSRASGNPNGAADACTSFGSGETEDYFVTISPGSPCTNPPTAGTATASLDSVCPGISFTLSLQGNSTGIGQTYQWQSSSDNISWTNITGATGITYSANQTASTYYRCMVTCGSSVASLSDFVKINAVNQCYCNTSLQGTACSASDNLNTVQIAGTTLNNQNTGCTNGNGQAYTVYPATGSTTASLQQGNFYTFLVTSTSNSIISIWIDFNQNGTLEASEWTQVTTSSTPDTPATISIYIPDSAFTGATRMRVRSRASGSPNGSTDACTEFFSGETEDYTVTIVAGTPCTTPPVAGTALGSIDSVCPGTLFTLTLTGNTSGTGQSYQWQSSPDNINWTDISGANSLTYSVTQTAATYYRCMVTCGTPVPSASDFVKIMTPAQCYCTPVHSFLCSTTDNIDTVIISGTALNNSGTGCTSGTGQSYTVYPASGSTTANLITGTTYSLSVTSTANSILSVWIDYDQSGTFDTSEWNQISTSSTPDVGAIISFTVPTSALNGQTKMRIRSRAAGNPNGASDPCTSFGSGETEDYWVTISSVVSCTNPPTAGIAVTSDTVVCSSDTFNLTLSGNSSGSGQTYQWQISPDNISWTNITGATALTYAASQASSNYYRGMVTCGSSMPSSSVFVNYNPCYCVPAYSSLCSSNDYIDDFTFNTLSKLNSGCNGNANNYIFDTTVTTTVVKGNTYNISMQAGSAYSQGFGVWIDYNKDGDFADSLEFVYSSPSFGTNIFTGTVSIPSSALPGITRLRVRCSYNAIVSASESCTAFSYGETEDYNISINAPAPCINPPTAGIAIANPGSVCTGGMVFLSLSGNSTGTGQTYQWQSSPDNVTYTNLSGAVYDTLSKTVTASTYFRCVISCGSSVNSASAQVVIQTLAAGTATGPALAIGNQVKTYNLTGSVGNIIWQVSSDGISFTDITGASSNPQNLLIPGSAQNDTLFIRAKVSGPGCADVFSNSVTTIIECATPYDNASSSGDFINKVIFNTINNSSTIDSAGGNVQDFKGTAAGTTNVCKGMSYLMTVSTDTAWTQGKAAWIDFNNNGSFADAGELVFGPTPSSKGAVSDTVFIPLTAVSDTVKMRVICLYNDTPDVNPCYAGPYGYGEIEEYSLIINSTPVADITASGPLTFCQGSSLILTAGTGGNYLWSTGAGTQSITVNSSGAFAVTVTNPGNCTSSDTVAVSVNPSPTAAATAANAACGSNNGSASVSVSGGTSPYTYLWSNSATTSTISALSAGTYFVTATDASGCTAVASASVNNAGGPSVAVSSTNVNCYGSSTGSALAVASGGATPYSYSWSNGQTTSSATGLAAGTYAVTVTDGNNCKASSAITITQPNQLLVAPSTTNVSCFGASNGSATANGMGGTSPYSYLWSNGSTAATVTGLAAGTYGVTITDNKSCTANSSIIITQPSAFSASISSMTNITCNGAANGSATVSAGGGTGPYSFLWSGGQNTPSVTNLGPGSHTVTVTDNNGCTANASVTISQPAAITLNISTSNAACGISNGSATVSVAGGTGSLSFLWSNGQTNSTASGLASGTYFVTVTDANNCANSASASVSNTGGPTVFLTSTDAICFGANDGSVSATVSGGTSPYSFDWSNNDTTSSINGLTAGIYSLTVTGSDGCSVSSSDTVSSPSQIQSAITGTNANCNGTNDGAATVAVTGGSSPYNYSWSNGQTNATATSLSAGNYSVTITDNKGCIDSSASVLISEPAAITLSTSSTNSACAGSTGTATALASGGAGVINYSWSNGMTGDSISGLPAGTYAVTATDSSGCQASANVSVSNSGAPLVSVSVNNIFCNGGNNGSATANATGGVTPYDYLWNDGQTSASAVGLTAGNYSVTVTDNNNCVTIKPATITEPTALVLTTSATDASCGSNNGSATASASGGVPPYQYNWASGQTTAVISGIAAGTYYVTVSDSNGCLQSSVVSVSNAGAPLLSMTTNNVTCGGGNDGSASVLPTGGISPYTFLWSNGQSTAAVTGLIEGNYSVTVTDSVNCMSVSNAVISADNPAPTIDLGPDTAACQGISLNAGTGFSAYLWSTGDTTQAVSAGVTGIFSVIITDTNACSASDSVNVTINSPTPIDLGPDSILCLETDTSYTLDAGAGLSSYSWSDNSTSQTLTVLSDGIYSVTGTDANGCTSFDSVSISFQYCSGIVETGRLLPFSFYPNPNKGIFTIINPGLLSASVTVYNMLGENAGEYVISAEKFTVIDLNEKRSGIYFIRINSGEIIFIDKIIVE